MPNEPEHEHAMSPIVQSRSRSSRMSSIEWKTPYKAFGEIYGRKNATELLKILLNVRIMRSIGLNSFVYYSYAHRTCT